MDAEPEYGEGKEIVDALSGRIELSHVSFAYSENMPNVIDDLSLKIKPGEYLAVVGTLLSEKINCLMILSDILIRYYSLKHHRKLR